MSEHLRHERAKRPSAGHRFGKAHANIESGEEVAARR